MSLWIDGYEHATPAERTERDRRVRWLLHEAGEPIDQTQSDERPRRAAYRVLMLGMVFGAIATILILSGASTDDGTLPILAVGGWIGIIASIICAVTYVFRLSSAAGAPLRHDEISRARSLADVIDRDSGPSNR